MTTEAPYVILKRTLTRCGFRQGETAIECRVTESYIGSVLNGRTPISARLAVRLGKIAESPEYWWKLQCDADLVTAYAEEKNGLIVGYSR